VQLMRKNGDCSRNTSRPNIILRHHRIHGLRLPGYIMI
jgi:hypothetical protein